MLLIGYEPAGTYKKNRLLRNGYIPPPARFPGRRRGQKRFESFYHLLATHPQFKAPLKHTIHYFDEAYDKRPLLWYRAQFPMAAKKPGFITGEKSTVYLYHPDCARRIQTVIPDVKLIFLLRDPVERAISQYFHHTLRGNEDLPLMEALEKEEERIGQYLDNIGPKTSFDPAHPLNVYSYKSRGHYAEQLERYFKYFSRDRIMIIKSENFFADPSAVMKDSFAFLGINPAFKIQSEEPRNVGPNKEDVPQEVYEYLRAYYRPHNERLKTLLGDEFSW